MKYTDAIKAQESGQVLAYDHNRTSSPRKRNPSKLVKVVQAGVHHEYTAKVGGWSGWDESRSTEQGLLVEVVAAYSGTQWLKVGVQFTTLAAFLSADPGELARTQAVIDASEQRAVDRDLLKSRVADLAELAQVSPATLQWMELDTVEALIKAIVR